MLEFSNYAKDKLMHSDENRGVLLSLKDENLNDFMNQFVGLRRKLYKSKQCQIIVITS